MLIHKFFFAPLFVFCKPKFHEPQIGATLHRVFPTGEMGGVPPPTSQKFAHLLPRKIPLLHQKSIPPSTIKL